MKTHKMQMLFLGVLLVSNAALVAGEYWVRPDGTDGTGDGSAGNPWVRTTALSFDGLVDGTNGVTIIPAYSTIHLMPGTFHTVEGIHPKDYWKIRGAGIDVTIVQIDSLDNVSPLYDTNGFSVIANGSGTRNDGVEVSELTVDCNLQATTAYQLRQTGVNLYGNNTRISRVKAINWGTTTAGWECFVLQIKAPNTPPPLIIYTNCVIEDCIIGAPAPVTHAQGATAISISGDPDKNGPFAQVPGDGWIENCEIRNCLIMGITAGAPGQPTYFNGIFQSYTRGCKITGNRVMHLKGAAIRGSCGSVYDLVIENNLLIDVWAGVELVGDDACGLTSYTKNNIQVINNYITTRDGGTGITLDSYGSQGTNYICKGNTVLAAGPLKQNGGVNLGNISVTFEDNVIDGIGGDGDLGFYYNNTKFVSIKNNKSSSGINIVRTDAQTFAFSPTSGVGWYRLNAGMGCPTSSGKVTITRAQTGGVNAPMDLEFNYTAMPSAVTDDQVGTITVLRNLGLQTPWLFGISKIRIGTQTPQSCSIYLDVYVDNPSGAPFTVKRSGGTDP